jgi:hypothetical protein
VDPDLKRFKTFGWIQIQIIGLDTDPSFDFDGEKAANFVFLFSNICSNMRKM